MRCGPTLPPVEKGAILFTSQRGLLWRLTKKLLAQLEVIETQLDTIIGLLKGEGSAFDAAVEEGVRDGGSEWMWRRS